MTLGTKLRYLRTEKKETLDVVAIKLNISKTAIAKWESDKSKPGIDNIMKICDYYETDIYKLLENVDNVNFDNVKFKERSCSAYNLDFTLNHTSSPDLLNSFIFNQKAITDLIKKQNDLITKLLHK